MKPLFSIITPCFNSGNTLRTTYESLLAQSFKGFEWILVDDASNDDGQTRALIEMLRAEAPFVVKVQLLDQNHFGSKSAVVGCAIAAGEYIGILDHDDQLTSDALTIAANYIAINGGNSKVAGVCGRCVDEFGTFIGQKFKLDFSIANEGDVRFTDKIVCELFQFTRIEIARSFFSKMKPGYTNGYVWADISRQYDYVFVNDIFRVYNIGLPTSYSNNKEMVVRYPAAKAEALKGTINFYRPYLVRNIEYTSRLLGSYLRHTINNDVGLFDALRGFDLLLKAWLFCVYPVSILKAKGWLG